MIHSHMPFFVNKNNGFFCISGDISIIEKNTSNIPGTPIIYRQWKAVAGNLETYKYVDFPFEPKNPTHVHCSPIQINNILNISYGRSLFAKEINGEWVEVKKNIWQGYFDGADINYVTRSACFIQNNQVKIPNIINYYRICPFQDKYIVTGGDEDKINHSILIDKDLNMSEIKVEGKPIYKCSIVDDTIFYSKLIKREVECYQIHTSTNFIFDPKSELLTS